MSKNIPLASRRLAIIQDLQKNEERENLKIELKEIMGSLKSYSLIEASSSFFSFLPILSALQNMRTIPMSNELVMLKESRPDYLPKTILMPRDSKFLKDSSATLIIGRMKILSIQRL